LRDASKKAMGEKCKFKKIRNITKRCEKALACFIPPPPGGGTVVRADPDVGELVEGGVEDLGHTIAYRRRVTFLF